MRKPLVFIAILKNKFNKTYSRRQIIAENKEKAWEIIMRETSDEYEIISVIRK